MAIKYEPAATLDNGGNFLSEPGTYHVTVLATNEQPVTKKDSKLIDGFNVTLSVIAGTVPDQEKKEIELTFYNGKLNDKDGGEFARKKQGRFLVAVGLLDENKPADIELSQAEGRQFIVTLARKKDRETGELTKFLEVNYSDIWHVDDPEAVGFPKNEKAISLLPANLRRKPDTFQKVGGNGKSKSQSSQQPVGAGAGSGVDLDNL